MNAVIARCSVASLKEAATLMSLVVERRNAIPVLGSVIADIKDGKLTITGTDLDMQITVPVDAECTGTGQFLITERTLRTLAAVATGSVTFEFSPGGNMVRAVTEGLTLKLRPVSEPIDFPWTNEAGDKLLQGHTPLQITTEALNRLLRLSWFCISNEETRYYLNGTFLCQRPHNGTLRAVATDGHRLALIDCDVPVKIDGDCFEPGILPRKAGAILRRLTSKASNMPVSLIWSGLRLRADVGGIIFHTRMIDGTFPDYTRVIPKEAGHIRAEMSVTSLRRINRMAQVMGGRANAVKIDPDRGEMSFYSPDTEGEVIVPMSGHGQSFGLNAAYLAAFASVAPNFVLTGAAPGDPFVVRGEDADAMWVIMPMRV